MNRRAVVATLVTLALLARCHGAPESPPPCGPVVPSPAVAGLPDDVVWGFADLHAHPAIEVAFDGRLVWGTALDDVPVDASELPAIVACPVETHDRIASSPIDRAVGGKIFPKLSALCGFAHAPVGSVDLRPVNAWPNGRDVIHQQMNVASIRRAYEGGLRLMFASTTDDQAIAALFRGPNMVDGFVPDSEADYRSARAQLELIRRMVDRNGSWMAVARSPSEARDIIKSGRLALVLSLEMDGLSQDDVDALVRDYGVQHVIPIHVIDNDVGGTAANGDLFNAASAAASQLYRPDQKPMRYMDVAPTAAYERTMGWPVHIGTLSPAPVYADLTPIPYSSYSELCYEPLGACGGTAATPESFIGLGQENARGLCRTLEECLAGQRPGKDRIAHLMSEHLFVDVSHMSRRSVVDTLDVAKGYPLMASHGDVVHLCAGTPTQPPCTDSARNPVTERSLDAEAARTIVASHGVLGIGTGVQNYFARPVLAARGGPLLTLDAASGRTTGCVVRSGATGCEIAPSVDAVDPATPIDTLQVQTVGGVAGAVSYAQPFVRVEMRAAVASDEHQRHVFVEPLACTTQGCSATIALGQRDGLVTAPPDASCLDLTCDRASACGATGYTVDDIQRVTLEWLRLGGGPDPASQCRSTLDASGPSWTIEQVTLGAGAATLARLGPRSWAPIARLAGDRGQLVVYERDDRPSAASDVLATGHLLRVSMTSSPGSDLIGASPAQAGANVCVALRQSSGGACAPLAPPPAPGATECPAGWWNLNQRGEWSSGVTLYTFARFAGAESSICGVDVSVLDWPAASAPFSIDEVRVEAIDDPVGHWVRRYAEISKHVADGRLGTLAFGTDFNGLNGMMDISEFPAPAGATTASACPVVAPLAPMRIRNADGSLGGQVLLEERGLATYGLLADLVAAIAAYPGCGSDVRDSLMLSAEATLRAWEAIVDPSSASRPPLPRATFQCGNVPGLGP